jgi:prevent-host-death family protein
MKTASVSDVKARLSAYLKASAKRPVVITKNGKPVGVLLGVDDEEELERLVIAYSPRLQSILNAARERIRKGRGIPHEQFWAQAERKQPPKKRRRASRTRPT